MKTIEELKASVLEDGIIDASEVLEIKETIYADGLIDKDEANFLFQLNDAVSGKDNAVEWQSLFVEALTDFVLKDEISPGEVDAEEAATLISQIKGDGAVDSIELALLVNIIDSATKCDDSLIEFTLQSVKEAVLADGVVDLEEVQMLKKVIYGEGGADGASVDRIEADLLFEINDAVSGKNNVSEWSEFFVEAISSHVLDDDESPNEIDEAEGDWLIAQIEGDGEYDETEKALLANIKAKATSITGKLKLKMEEFA